MTVQGRRADYQRAQQAGMRRGHTWTGMTMSMSSVPYHPKTTSQLCYPNGTSISSQSKLTKRLYEPKSYTKARRYVDQVLPCQRVSLCDLSGEVGQKQVRRGSSESGRVWREAKPTRPSPITPRSRRYRPVYVHAGHHAWPWGCSGSSWSGIRP
jgi:hypothetical protein